MAPGTATKPRTKAQELAPRILELLPGKQGDIAKALDRKPSDGTVRRALELLATQGFATRVDGTWNRCQSLPADPAAVDGVVVPGDFDQASVALYWRTREQLVEQESWKDSDAPLLERYIRALQDERRYREEADGDEFNRAQTGRVFIHPAVKLANEREAAANSMAEKLLLTPESRRRAGRLPKGDGSGGGGDEFDF